MGNFASKGVAGTGLGLGIAGTALALLNNGGLGGILGGNGNGRNHEPMESKESAALRGQVAMLEAERYSDNKTSAAVLDLYKFTTGELKERDTLIVNNLVTSARNEEKFNCLSNKVDTMENIVSLHTDKLCQIGTNEAVTNERLTALAINSSEANKAQSREFYSALHAQRGWTESNFVPYAKKIDSSLLCPQPEFDD